MFKLCHYLIEDNIAHTDLWLDIEIDYMECLYISEKIDEATVRYNNVRELCTDDQLLLVDMSFLKCYAFSSDWENVLSLGNDILEKLNFCLDKTPLILDLIYFKFLYRHSRLKSIFDAMQVKDDRVLNIMHVLSTMFPAANRINLNLFTRTVLKLAFLTARYGNSEYSGIGYACAVYLMYHGFKDYKTGDLLQNMTLEYLDKPTDNKSIPYALIGTFTYHWSNPFINTITVLDKSISYGQIEQEFMYSNYAAVFSVITKYVSGVSLSQLKGYINDLLKVDSRIENFLTRYMCSIHLVNIHSLSTGEEKQLDIPNERQAFYDTITLNYDMLKFHRLFILGETRKAYSLAEEIENRVDMHKGFVLNGDFYFYSALVRMAIYNVLDKKEKRNSLKLIKKHIKDFEVYAKYNNNSHKAKIFILEAEYSHRIRSVEYNEKNYYRAMVFAKKIVIYRWQHWQICCLPDGTCII